MNKTKIPEGDIIFYIGIQQNLSQNMKFIPQDMHIESMYLLLVCFETSKTSQIDYRRYAYNIYATQVHSFFQYGKKTKFHFDVWSPHCVRCLNCIVKLAK